MHDMPSSTLEQAGRAWRPHAHSGQNRPANDDAPPPAPTWKPEVREPDPDLLPDEMPVPNPDENRDPQQQAGSPR